MTRKPHPIKLHLCFDFDETLTKHQMVGFAWMPASMRFVRADEMKGGAEIGRLFHLAHEKGHKLSITSYNHDEDMIKAGLKAVGVSEELISKIAFVCHLNRHQHAGKILHTEIAAKWHGIDGDSDYKTVLVDDNPINTSMARGHKQLALQVVLPKPQMSHSFVSKPLSYDLSHLRVLEAIIDSPENVQAILAAREERVLKHTRAQNRADRSGRSHPRVNFSPVTETPSR
jgi:hypothetical protein